MSGKDDNGEGALAFVVMLPIFFLTAILLLLGLLAYALGLNRTENDEQRCPIPEEATTHSAGESHGR